MHWLVLEHGSANFISTAAVAQYLKRELEVCCCLTHSSSRTQAFPLCQQSSLDYSYVDCPYRNQVVSDGKEYQWPVSGGPALETPPPPPFSLTGIRWALLSCFLRQLFLTFFCARGNVVH